MSIEDTLDRLATNVALVAGAISTLAEAVNGTYKGKQIYADAPAPAATTEASAKQLEAVTTIKRGPGRPPKAAAAPADQPAPVAQETASVQPAPTPSTANTSVTKEQVAGAALALIKANKRDTVVKILGEHGAQSVSALASEHYAAAHAKFVAATPAA
jgi:hypothetical protein